jgi:HPt (histidine-containing phosphotransfer) domain-containing protein
MGNAKLADNVLARFQTQVAGELVKLKETLAAGDIQRLTRIAHAVKGTAANVSAEPVRYLADELERLGREGNLQAAEQKLEDLRTEVERCVAFLQQRKIPIASSESLA